jgi:hypothetical protein
MWRAILPFIVGFLIPIGFVGALLLWEWSCDKNMGVGLESIARATFRQRRVATYLKAKAAL